MPSSENVNKPKPDRYSERLHIRRHLLTPSILKVADYIDNHRSEILHLSALEIAGRIGTSDATVIRATQALGFSGLIDLKDALESGVETDNPSDKLAKTVAQLDRKADSAIDFVLNEHRHAIISLDTAENRSAIAKAISILARVDRIAIFGLGASGVLATYTARLFNRNGSESYALNATGGHLAEQLQMMQAGDGLLIMLRNRQHRESNATIAEAKRLSMPVILISGGKEMGLKSDIDCSIEIPRSRHDHAPLHGPTLLCLEILAMGVAAVEPTRALNAMGRFVSLRRSILSVKKT